jgi:hypothetical protein
LIVFCCLEDLRAKQRGIVRNDLGNDLG